MRPAPIAAGKPSEEVYEKPFCRGMGILPMRRRAILALQLAFSLRAASLVKRTARMAVPLLIHVLKKTVASRSARIA